MTDENESTFKFNVAEGDSGYTLSAQQLYDALKTSDVQAAGGYVPDTVIQSFLDSMISDTLLGFEANTIDLRHYYEDNWTYRLRYTDALLQEYLVYRVYDRVKVDSSEVLDFYQKRADLFHVPEQVELSHILIVPSGLKNGRDSLYYRKLSKDEFEQEMRDYAFNLYEMLCLGEPFANVAYRYSHDDATRDKSGYQGWTVRNTYLAPFDSVAFSTKPGEFSKPYRDKDGWHILYINDYLPEGEPPISRPEVYQSALATLRTIKSNDTGRVLMDSLHAQTKLEANDKILDTNIYKVDDSVWAGIVNQKDTFDCKYLKNLEEGYRQKYKVKNTTPDMKRQMLNTLAERFMLLQAAEAAGLDTIPRIKQELAGIRHTTARSIMERNLYDAAWVPTTAAVDKYYAEHQSQFIVAKPLTVQQIVCSDSLFAEFLRDQADAGVDFLDLAQKYYPGESSVRVQLADMGAIGPNDVDSAFYLTALGTPVGDISRPVKTKYGYQIIKVLKHEDSRGLEQARGEIQTTLANMHRQEKARQFRESLIQKYHIRFPGKIKSVHLKPYLDRTKKK
ncbi:MAG TPA: peptidylprolyl isomerase [Candidatus Acidoferrum sp.]|nr:peptidylprolyl isomerase [Candidatus Acidoferrum sp.]